jgi:hypothetical protein
MKNFKLLYSLVVAFMVSAALSSFAEPSMQVSLFGGLFAMLGFGTLVLSSSSNLSGLAFTTLGAAVSGQDYYANYITTLDLQARKVLPQLTRRYGSQGKEFFDTIRALGFERVDGIQTIEHYEEEWIWNNFAIASQTGAGTNTGTFVLAASALDPNSKFFPQVGNTIILAGDIPASIISITGAGTSTVTLSVVTHDTNDLIPTVAAGQELFIASSVAAEGSGQPGSIISGIISWANKTQTIKSTRVASGRELSTESWIKMVGSDKVESWANKGFLDLEYEQQLKIQGAFLSGKQITNTGMIINGQSLVGEGTRGLLPELNSYAIQYGYTPGTWELQDYYNMVKAMKKQYTNQFVALFCGLEFGQEQDQMLFEANKDTAVVYAERAKTALFGAGDDGREMDMHIGFKYLHVDGYTFCIKNIDSFYHPKLYGTSGYNYVQRGMAIPLQRYKDPITKNSIPSIGVVYRGLGKYNRKMKVWQTGANADVPTDDFDVKRVNMLTEMAGEFFATNQMVNIIPNS